ncbi:GNAT family N-acetyltransferase [Virgibacillus necropolis]|uniref:GNAT family N-acetyltransferase n=1 Tax=Virgibacillus necropolis TaxID=163877 RepID=UPI00384DFE7F
MNYIIRKMKKDDIQQVQEVAKITWNATYEGIIPLAIQENFLNASYNEEMLKNRLERSFIFVAEENNRVLGYANFSPVKDGGATELGAIYLLPETQGNGIGTALLNEGIKNIQDVNEIYINVEKENITGKGFYKAKGFETVSEFDDNLYGHITKMVRMRLKVS